MPALEDPESLPMQADPSSGTIYILEFRDTAPPIKPYVEVEVVEENNETIYRLNAYQVGIINLEMDSISHVYTIQFYLPDSIAARDIRIKPIVHYRKPGSMLNIGTSIGVVSDKEYELDIQVEPSEAKVLITSLFHFRGKKESYLKELKKWLNNNETPRDDKIRWWNDGSTFKFRTSRQGAYVIVAARRGYMIMERTIQISETGMVNPFRIELNRLP